jgi:FkbM family methyltransferase
MIIHCDSTRYITEVFEHKEYAFLFREYEVIDLGCNIGAFSFFIYPYAKNIHAIDISRPAISYLEKTIKDNNLNKIHIYNIGISGKNETRYYLDFGGGGSHLEPSGDKKIKTMTLNTFMEKNKIEYVDILKIDVEGAEGEIFMADDFPTKKITTIIGELHPMALAIDFEKLLNSKGYRYFSFPDNRFLARRI